MLGRVKSIREQEVIVALPDGLEGVVGVQDISMALTNRLQEPIGESVESQVNTLSM